MSKIESKIVFEFPEASDGWQIKEPFKHQNEQKELENNGVKKTYTLAKKYFRELSCLERVGRILLGSICYLFTASYAYHKFKFVRQLFHKTTESCVVAVPFAPPTPPVTEESSLNNHFFNVLESWSFLDQILEAYRKDIENKSVEDNKGIIGDLQAILCEIEDLEKHTISLEQKIKQATPDSPEIKYIEKIKSSAREFREKNELLIKKTLAEKGVIGLANARNTCYINSALQPLIALNNLQLLVPESIEKDKDETDEAYKGRKKILAALNNFFEARKNKQSPEELGKLVGNLRNTIFSIGLDVGGLRGEANKEKYQDAGQFFELMMYVIGRRFELITKKVGYLSDNSQAATRESRLPAAIFDLKMDSPDHADSAADPAARTQKFSASNVPVQQVVNSYLHPVVQGGDEWRVPHPDTGEVVEVDHLVEETKICGNPPEFLIVRVQFRVVNLQEDEMIDFSPLFETPVAPDQARYKLVGFSQNLSNIHWTSVVRVENGWAYCNDRVITLISPNDEKFTKPAANYMVYKKV